MRIIQVMNALDRADAVSQALLETDRMLRQLGHTTEIYTQFAHPDLATMRRDIADLPRAQGDLLLFHYAGFSPLLGLVAQFRGKRGVVFHNVTPSRFFEDVPKTYEFCRKGHEQIARLKEVFQFGIGVSTFNADVLQGAGFTETRVVPLAWESSGLDEAVPDEAVRDRAGGEEANILMVGRVSRHKGVHFAVRAMREITARLESGVRLTIVGKTKGYEAYGRELEAEIRVAGPDAAIETLGDVTLAELKAHYQRADALLVMSDHEGFCVPIVEAAALGVPVVAYDAGAVAETLGDGGILLQERTPDVIAEAVVRVLPGGPERTQVLERQRRRLGAFTREAVQDSLRESLAWIQELPEPPAQDVPPPSMSVVVCTYNRDWVLEQCLEALERLDYPDYEVVVVNGPSTDRTAEVVERFPQIKRVDNPLRNLSVSRNLGIAAAAGDVVAFIDDDAMPNPDWLRRLGAAYADPTVGAVGGKVHGPGGGHLQFDNGIISRWGLPRAVQDEPDDKNAPTGEWYNILMGTNSSFRRLALEDVGGFDENYEYYHDESDLCVRVIRAGYRVVHVPEAEVWHEFEKSHNRVAVRDINWTVIVKNTIYFYFKLNAWKKRPWDWAQPMRACLVHLGIFSRWFVHGEIGVALFTRALARWSLGVAQGYSKGWFVPARRHLSRHADERSGKLQSFNRPAPLIGNRRLHIALVSQQYPPDACGGIGVYTEQLARGLVEAGHRVRVIAQGRRDAVVWRDGVQVHRLRNAAAPAGIPHSYGVTRKNVGRSLAVHRFLHDLHERSRVDIVESPLWDAEPFALSLRHAMPLVIRVETPMAMAIETQGWKRTADLELACAMEWAAVADGPNGLIDPSGTILEMFREKYGVTTNGSEVREIPFGIVMPPAPPPTVAPPSDPVKVLFLGRLEPRKGIDVLVGAIPRVLEQCPDVEFHIAGEAPSSAHPRNLLADASGAVRERVHFLGRIDDAERERLYLDCDLFVAPSRYESFGLVYIEAFARGKPVIACDAGGPRRIVDHGQTGLLVPPGDVDALAEAMIRLVRDPEERHRMGRTARAKAEAEYGVDRMVRRTLDFYESILERGAANA